MELRLQNSLESLSFSSQDQKFLWYLNFFSFHLSNAFDAQVKGKSSCLGFAGLLFSDVPGIGSHRFLAWPHILTCKSIEFPNPTR